MTDKTIKEMLKNAYAISETEKGKVFVRKFEQRSLNLSEIIKLEFRYMGVKSFLAGVVLTVLLLIAAQMGDIDMMWTFTAFIPMCALIPMLLISRSERFGMNELEAASRFSLRFIRVIRMCILGIFSMAILLTADIILRATAIATFSEQMIFLVFPYFISTYGAMLVTRKWHGKENVFGVLAVCASAGLLPFVIKPVMLPGEIPDGFFLLALTLLLVALTRECMLYVKESEDLSWNLC